MYQFSIKDIENLTGIKAHTLRIWEQRYTFHLCKRKDNKHRFYDNDDLKQILRIAYLYKNGYKISKIARLGQEQMLELFSQAESSGNTDVFINQLLEASIDFDQDRSDQIVQRAIEQFGLEEFMLTIAFVLMEKIGVLWLTNHVIPAQEHFSSALIRNKLMVAINGLPNTNRLPGRHFLLFTPEGEEHELSLLFAQYLLKKHGFQVSLMGKNISIATLQYFCDRQSVSDLYFHLTTNFTSLRVDNYLQQLAVSFPNKKITCAGRALLDTLSPAGNVTILKSLKEMTLFTSGN